MSRPTTECHLRDDEQVKAVQIIGVSPRQDGIGSAEVAIDVADLRREL
jgi:hypothetical protein